MPAMQPGDGVRSRRDWLADGACRNEDPELFFPLTAQGPAAKQIMAAKAVCGRCLVRLDCLRYALEDRHSYGIWGGTSEEERRALRRSRSRARRALTPGDPRRDPAAPAAGRHARARRPA